MQTQKFM